MKRSLIWDIPTRLFHWLFAISFAVAWVTTASDRWLSIHSFFGYLMLGLIGFRLVWGFAGGHYARFASFLYSPKEGLAYLRELAAKKAQRHVGHNPAGSQAIYLMLILGLAICVSGVFTQGGEEQHSVAAGALSISTGTMLKQAHKLISIVMLLLVIGHVAAVVFDSWLHMENLALSMMTGMKEVPDGSAESKSCGRVGVLLLVSVAAFAVWWFFYALQGPIEKRLGRGNIATEGPRVAFVGRVLPDDPKWREECGSCHLAFHPNLLPARSWTRVMAEQATHFGTDLALDSPTRESVLAFMVNNAAENSSTEAAFKISRSIGADVTPLRITETPYWISKHDDIRDATWRLAQVKSKTNCAACHLDAVRGTFEDAAMRIPR
jgi:cytochrome b